MNLYCLKDNKSGMFGPVMMAHSDAHMGRNLKESLGGTNATPARFPEDYDLYLVGDFGEETAAIVSEVRFVCNLSVILPVNGGPNA